MAISFVGAGSVVTGANPTVPVPAGIAAGDLLLIIASSNATFSLPAGWAQFYSQGAGQYIIAFAKQASSSESSVTLTAAGTTTTACMIAYRGAGYYDVIGTAATGSSTTATTGTITTTRTNDYVLSIFADVAGTASTWTAPGSTTTRVDSSSSSTNTGLLIVDELKATAGLTTAQTATISTSASWSALTLSLREPTAFYVNPDSGSDANNGQSFATAFKNLSAATSAKLVGPGDTVRVKESPLYNTGVNATWTSVQQRGISPFGTQAITNASNTTPIVITTSLNHGYSTGDVVLIANSTNSAANGIFKVTVVNSTNFSLDDSSNNGTSGSGGTIGPIFCRTIKTATPLVKPIASYAPSRTASLGARAAWVGANANITATITNGVSKGAFPDTITIAAGATTGKMAYYTLPSTLDLSSYQQLSLYINQSSGTLGGLTISLCSDTIGAVPVNTFTIPSTGALNVWCPFTFDNGSALGSSIQSISISRAANNGAQGFQFNSIVACKAPTAVDGLSNNSFVTKNNGTEGAYAIAGFGGSDGSIIFLQNSPFGNELTTTGGAYYGTTETVALYRTQPFNPWTLNGVALPSSSTTANSYCTLPANSGAVGIPITYSGGWNSTDMSTRTGQTWFDNGNGYGYGLQNAGTYNNLTLDRLNYGRVQVGYYLTGNATVNTIQNCNYTAGIYGVYTTNLAQVSLQNCILTNHGSYNAYFSYGSTDINNPTTINNCTFSGAATNNLAFSITAANYPYNTITNSSFNTCGNTAITSSAALYGAITNNSINYFNTVGINANAPWLGTINNLTLTLEPQGCTTIFQCLNSATYVSLPQNVYSTWNNVTVNAPTTQYSQTTTAVTQAFSSCPNYKFVNISLPTTNISYTYAAIISEAGSIYLYNSTGIPTATTTVTNVISPYINNAAMYAQDNGGVVGNNRITFTGGLATSQTAVRHTPSGYAWSMAPTSTTNTTSTFPMKLKIASVAANSGSPVTISAWMQRTNTGLTMQLVCPAYQPYGPTTDTTASMTAAANTWEQVSISFTPTQNGVFDIYAYAYGGTTYTGYVDDLSVTQ